MQAQATTQQQYTRGQLRDLLVEFYSRIDPARLESGLDVNGMIDWIVYNGINDMNMRLQAKYGTGFNFDIVAQQSQNNQMSAMHRISMMPNTELIEQQAKRLELRDKVVKFYQQHDPDKVGSVDTFVEWIEVNGIKAFNDLLQKKYGVGLITKPVAPTPPAAFNPVSTPAPVGMIFSVCFQQLTIYTP